MSLLVASDLDRTLIYSRSAMRLGGAHTARQSLTCVETHDDRQASFMTRSCAHALAELAERVHVVPVTTRTAAQYARVRLPMAEPKYAVAANGGVLYVDGVADQSWGAGVRRRLDEGFPLTGVWEYLTHICHHDWTVLIRNADELFCYAVIKPRKLPAGFVENVRGWAAERGWRTSLQGRKLYWVPEVLTKSAALAEIARRTHAQKVLAAGDSLLDADMLQWADLGIHPLHGELYESGWSAENVTRTSASGAEAGEQIVAWFTEQVPPD